MSDGMKDLGNLPRKVKGLRNLTSKATVWRDSYTNEVGEFLEAQWEAAVRFAFAHQDEIEMLMTDEAELEAEEAKLEETKQDTAATLRKVHYKALCKKAKDMGLTVEDGETKEQVIEKILAVEV